MAPQLTVSSKLKLHQFLCRISRTQVAQFVHRSVFRSACSLERQSVKELATQTPWVAVRALSGHRLLWPRFTCSTSKIHGRLKVVRNGENLAFHEVNMSVENTVVRSQSLSELQIGYLAGIMDGEGCITFVYHKSKTNVNVLYSPVVYVCAVANSNPLIIQTVESLLKNLPIRYKVYSPKKEWNKKAKKKPYAIHLMGMNSAKHFLNVICEHLSGKKKQAELVLEYLERREEGQRVKCMTERDWQIIHSVRDMNKNYGADFTVETKRQPSVTAEEVIVQPA